MTDRFDKAVVVTGASTGIGRAAVASIVRGGGHAFGSVRKQEDADGLVAEFGEGVTPLLFDVTQETGVRAGASQVAAALGRRRLFGLVNNAGIAVPGPLLHIPTEDLERQFKVNLFGVHNATRAFAPLLGTDRQRDGKPGRIVMISSVGGQNASPFVGPYSASKFAMEGYSESLRRELMLYGIDVIIIGPGAIATPIWEKAEQSDLQQFEDTEYAPMVSRVADYMIKQGREGLPAEQVGDLIWQVLTEDDPNVRYAILRRPFMDRTLPRVLPKRMVDRIIARRLGFPVGR
ncbi:MAG: SDR family oxidoreductase [Hyphomonadaceae bacterium]